VKGAGRPGNFGIVVVLKLGRSVEELRYIRVSSAAFDQCSSSFCRRIETRTWRGRK
jgi:ribosomal protein L37AE/L43A